MITKLNREWVKSAAIVFLAVMLLLTFFSNTIMNRTLPEVATQGVMSGSITAKVRGTGAVTANGLHEVKADDVREIRTVMVKTGQEVNAGDVLFILGKGDSDELEAAQENLESLQTSYNTTALGYESDDEAAKRKEATDALTAATTAENAANAELKLHPTTGLAEAKERLNAAVAVRDALNKQYNDELETYREALEKANADVAVNQPTYQAALDEKAAYEKIKDENNDIIISTDPTVTQEQKDAAQTLYDDADQKLTDNATKYSDAATNKTRYENAQEAALTSYTNWSNLDATKEQIKKVEDAQTEVAKREAEVTGLSSGNVYAQALEKATEKRQAAQDRLDSLNASLASKNKSNSTTYIQLQSQAAQIERARAKVLELSGEEGKQITANVSGTIQSVDCTAGNTVEKDALLCTIEVPDMGYGVSFSVTSEQARRLRVGDTATVSNYYWGKEIIATLTSIKTDPKSPQANKILSFELDGDVDAGGELTLSVGQKSATYDTVIPNSSIRSDTNGSFVLKIEAKSSPLGNRYIARRVSVEVLAADDLNSAVTGDLSNGDYVITTSNSPVANGDQVKMADS